MTSDWRSLMRSGGDGKRLLVVAAILVAVAGFLVCLAYGHWARDPDPSIGRTFPLPGRRGLSYVTLPGFVGSITAVVALVYVSFNWRSLFGQGQPDRSSGFSETEES